MCDALCAYMWYAQIGSAVIRKRSGRQVTNPRKSEITLLQSGYDGERRTVCSDFAAHTRTHGGCACECVCVFVCVYIMLGGLLRGEAEEPLVCL